MQIDSAEIFEIQSGSECRYVNLLHIKTIRSLKWSIILFSILLYDYHAIEMMWQEKSAFRLTRACQKK
jgi:hypothetical protein